MSTIIFMGQATPDKRLLKETTYKYQPDSDMKAQIISDLEKHMHNTIPENVIIDLNIVIKLKEYDYTIHPEDKNQWYQESLNTKKEE